MRAFFLCYSKYMNILMQTPVSLLEQNNLKVIGANKISRVILDVFIRLTEYSIIIVTDASSDQCKSFEKILYDNYGKVIIVSNYDNLTSEIDISTIDIAFVNDIKMNRMLHFRSTEKLLFPVVSLIHSFGTRTAYHDYVLNLPFIKKCDIYICPSYDTQQTLIKLGFPKKQTSVLHYGLNTQLYTPVKDKRKLRKRYNFPLNKDILLILSRITPALKMDLFPIFRMMPELIEKNKNIHLLIVGVVHDQSYFNELLRYIDKFKLSDYITFESEPNQDYIEHYYQLSDVFLSLTDYCGETYGLTVMEAMSCQLPVVINKMSGYKMHITNSKEGYYIPAISGNVYFDSTFFYRSIDYFGDLYAQSISHDNSSLINALISLTSNISLRLEMGKNARNTIINRNTLQHMINGFSKIFKHAVSVRDFSLSNITFTPYSSINALLSHFPTRYLQKSDVFYITKYAKDLLEKNKEYFIFESHLNRYKQINDILYLISNGVSTLVELLDMINVPAEEVEASLLYLIKHNFVAIST